MNITLSIPKKNVKVVGNRATISVSPKKLEQALSDAEKKAWETEIFSRKVDPKKFKKTDFIPEKEIWKELKIA